MKKLLALSSILVGLSTSMAYAAANIDGLECTMKYKNSSMFSPSVSSQNFWLVAGGEATGSAVAKAFEDTPANYITVLKTTIAGKKFWQVAVLDSKKERMGALSFIRDEVYSPNVHGAKVSFPVKAFDTSEEDPASFDELEVICKNAVFAG